VTIGNLANVASARGDIDTAKEQFERAIRISVGKLGEQHLETMILRNNLAHALQKVDRTEEAIEQLRIVVANAEQGLGVEDHQTAHFRGNLGADLLILGEFAEAEVELRESLRVLDATLGEGAGLTMNFRRQLVTLLRKTDRETEAASLEASLEAKADQGEDAASR
jgi:tetratricopeptide (TPR) repeat protein